LLAAVGDLLAVTMTGFMALVNTETEPLELLCACEGVLNNAVVKRVKKRVLRRFMYGYFTICLLLSIA
jgi:hypothetical protein